MITDDQAIRWLWEQYISARTLSEIEMWFDRFSLNREKQRALAGI